MVGVIVGITVIVTVDVVIGVCGVVYFVTYGVVLCWGCCCLVITLPMSLISVVIQIHS